VAAALREAGCRFSAARRIILDVLFAAEGPVSAEYVADGLGGQLMRSDLSSVYRNLELLEELGVVRHVHIGHGPSLYAISGRPPCEYMVCERCDAVKSLPLAALEPVRAEIRATYGYEVRFSHFPLVGLCPHCAASHAAGEGGPSGPSESRRTGDKRQPGHRHDQTHSHQGGAVHDHTASEHQHTEHDHEHSHGDRVHSHSHVHETDLEGEHAHQH